MQGALTQRHAELRKRTRLEQWDAGRCRRPSMPVRGLTVVTSTADSRVDVIQGSGGRGREEPDAGDVLLGLGRMRRVAVGGLLGASRPWPRTTADFLLAYTGEVLTLTVGISLANPDPSQGDGYDPW